MKQRGMVKWQPFASLPEQAEYINKLIYEMNKVPRPILSDDQLDELNERLYRYFENKEMVSLHYYHDGYIYLVEGIIDKIDIIKKTIIIDNNHKKDKFSIASIVNIELI
ncbi:YolD-like family protein [Mycoplasmatota bacterium]|nr:YolD-like family protein [Mycoplasmatota bacterium]